MGEEKIYRIIPTLAYKCADNRTKRTLEGFLNAIFDYNPKLDVPKWHEISYSFANPKRENGKLVDFDNFILTDRQLKAIKFTGRKLKDRAIFEHEIDLSEKVDSEMEDKLEKTKSIIEDINSNKYPELDKKGVFKFHCLNKVFKVETTVKMAMLISSRFKTDNIDFKPYDRKRNDTFIKDDKFTFVRKIRGDTPRQNMEVTKTINNEDGHEEILRAVYKPTLNVRVKTIDVAEGKKTSCEYGEFIAHKMLEKMGIPSCKVEFTKRHLTNPRSKSGKGNDIPGVLSYIDLKPGETLITADTIISRFKQKYKEEFFDIIGLEEEFRADYNLDNENDINNNNIEVIIPAFMSYITNDCNGTKKLAKEVKQSIIDMTTFDCMMANRDRHSENYGIAFLKQGKVRFYPLYDNEYILGFSEAEKDIGKYNATGLQEHINNDLYSVIGVTSKPTKLSPSAMMAYLFSAYPIETQKAYEKVSKFTLEDLEELMDECEGLPDTHKAYASRIFKLRTREIETIQEEFIDKNGKPIEQKHLPGNKINEHVKGTGNSSSRKKSSKSETSNEKEGPSLDD